MPRFTYPRDAAVAMRGAEHLVLLASESVHKKGWLKRLPKFDGQDALVAAVKKASASSDGTPVTTLSKDSSVVTAVLLADSVSRHNSPTRHEAITASVRRASLGSLKKATVILAVDNDEHIGAVVNAVGRALPEFQAKTGKKGSDLNVKIVVTDRAGAVLAIQKRDREVMKAARWAAEMVDMPTSQLDTEVFVKKARALCSGLSHVKLSVIKGKKLLDKGLGGIHAVGRTALVEPRLLLLEYSPAKPRRRVALVGKGIVYDTGGLSLKSSTAMCSMKGDMGGAAAATGAFYVLASTKSKDRILCAIPLAENAIGPGAYRPDDILTLHSKKTVEINNTDAEGRLVLADAASYAARTFRPDVLLDAATLTGAQLISSGLCHSSVVTNRDGIERLAVKVGRASGDLAHPLLFVPEFYKDEFRSKVADMRNSVSNRMNAQSSCAAWFIHAHIDDLDIPWIHIDLAGPSWRNGRGTGYGVALMTHLVVSFKDSDLKK